MSSAPNQIWQRNPALAWREIDEETVIISPDESMMHELNDTGSFIWKHVDGHRSAAEIAQLLVADYAVSPEVALTDTESLLDEMSARQLLLPAGGAIGGKLR